MGNPYFHFKEFSIQQGTTAMKVCTDACLFGAWVASLDFDAKNILDIGTGTGLLSLMLAQKKIASITAIEIDKNAFQQANSNFLNSPWKDRLKALNVALQDFETPEKFDLIICNPPFFKNDLRPGNKANLSARHEEKLTLNELIIHIVQHIADDGMAAILIPYHRLKELKALCELNTFYIINLVLVKQSVNHHFFRAMALISKQPAGVETSEITIKEENGEYSQLFSALLKHYYLKL